MRDAAAARRVLFSPVANRTPRASLFLSASAVCSEAHLMSNGGAAGSPYFVPYGKPVSFGLSPLYGLNFAPDLMYTKSNVVAKHHSDFRPKSSFGFPPSIV